MNTVIRVIMCMLGGICIIVGLSQLVFMNVDFGIVCAPIIGAALLLYGIFFDYVNQHTQNKFLKALRYAVIFALCFIIAFSGFLCLYGSSDNVTYDEDSLIILGAGIHGDKVSLPLQYRLDAALEYIDKNPDVLVIVSGGKGFQEDVTEAYAMEKYLVDHGANPDNIIKEENASSTTENFKFSKEILDRRFQGGTYKVATVTNDFHVFRAVKIAEQNGLEVTHLHGKIPWYTTISNYIRETAAITKLIILGY